MCIQHINAYIYIDKHASEYGDANMYIRIY